MYNITKIIVIITCHGKVSIILLDTMINIQKCGFVYYQKIYIFD